MSDRIDPRVVANLEQARNLLAAVPMWAGTGVEAVGLVETDSNLPEHGWGSALLHRTRPSVGKQWTDSGKPMTTAG